MTSSTFKAWSARARESAAIVRKGGSALGTQPGQLSPAIAARVKEILAEKANKGKKKAGGKGKGKAKKVGAKKDGRTPQEKSNQNRASVAKQGGMEKLEGVIVRLGAGMHSDLEKDAHDELISKGLAQRHADGTVTLSAAGKKWKAAADKGDADAAAGALTDAKVKVADDDAKAKAKADKQAARDQAKAERARLKAEKLAKKQKATKAFYKAIEELDMSDDPTLAIKAGARHSASDTTHLNAAAMHVHALGGQCPDCADEADTEEAAKAIKAMTDNPTMYAMHECEDIQRACGALQSLVYLLQSEVAEEDEDPQDVSQLVSAARILVKFISSELDELESAGDGQDDLANEPKPQTIKGIEDVSDDLTTIPGYATKAMGDGLVGGYLIKFGGDGDLSQWRDVFTKATDFGTHTKSDVWVHHRMLPGLGKQKLTNQAELGMDDEGVFVKHLLNLRNTYEAKLYSMVEAGKLGWSSGTAPHLVERKALEGGRHEITQWPLGVDASYTPTPAGGLVVNAGAMKSLFAHAGIDLLTAIYDNPEAPQDEGDRSDATKAQSDRARKLSIQRRLIQLREIMNGPTS